VDGTAIRVPTPNVSLVSLDVVLKAPVTAAQINDAMLTASRGALRGILDVNTEKLVSVDFNHTSASCTFDATQTAVVDEGIAHVVGWYDNEWGFAVVFRPKFSLCATLKPADSRGIWLENFWLCPCKALASRLRL
jgi:glyceraldehyde 3-phosphate dehydrogenase